jgi:hypothetical protein
MKRMMAAMLSIALAGSVIVTQAQQETAPATKKTVHKKAVEKGPTVSEQLSEMKAAIDAQQAQIKQLSDLVQSRDEKIQRLEQRLDQNQVVATQAQSKADTAVAQTSDQQQTVMALKSDVTDLKTTATSNAMTLQETQKSIKDAMESPMAIHFKGITLTPGGFVAAESVYRNRALGEDINTSFNSVSMPGSGMNAISEFFGSGRQSRISLLAEGKLSMAKLSGYYEADFLSAGVTSNNNQSNSYTMRQRQVWGQAAFDDGLTLTGGQMWSLVAETKHGVDNRTEATPLTIDPAYTVGFSWARQYGFRVAKNFNNHFWLAASLENPQTIFGGTQVVSNFAFGSTGVTGGVYDNQANYSFNATPDLIVKAAFEPGFGHYEIFGIYSRFRDRVYPCVEYTLDPSLCGTTAASAIGAYNDSKNGGGVGGNARVTIAKHLDVGLHAIYGNGVGRYGASGLPDATVNADGTLAPLRSYQGLVTLEYHTPKIDVYLNGGEEYVRKRWELDPVSLKPVGYGSPLFNNSNCYTETTPGSGGYAFGALTCSGQTQSTVEGTFGFWIRPYHGPKGRIQIGPQYSYLVRNAWAGCSTGTITGGVCTGPYVSPHGIDNMFLTSFRYYLP